jgi:hypothetical protein
VQTKNTQAKAFRLGIYFFVLLAALWDTNIHAKAQRRKVRRWEFVYNLSDSAALRDFFSED